MALGLFDRLGGILGFIIFDTSHMTGMTSKARRETFMAPNRIIVASPWDDLNTDTFTSPADPALVSVRSVGLIATSLV